MKKILIDVDEVICENQYLEKLNNYLNTNYKIEDFSTYYIDEIIEDEAERRKMNEYIFKFNLYESPRIIEGAVETIKKLNQKYEVYILSACVNPIIPEVSGDTFKQKYEFIINTLPFLNPKNIILTNAKGLIQADIIIDDKLKNLKSGSIPERLMFSTYHNKKLTDEELAKDNVKRVNSWKDVEKILL